MKRRLTSKHKRRILFNAAEGKCQICGCELGAEWHADHIIPWCVTGRTNVYEMQALCAACNLKKGASMNIQRFEGLNSPNMNCARRGQRDAYNVTMRKITERTKGESCNIALVLPTRYGKSDLMRCLAVETYISGKVSYSVVVSPATTLRDQILDKKKWLEARDRYSLGDKGRIVRCFSHVPSAPPHPKKIDKGVFLLSVTTQSLSHNIDDWGDWVDSVIHTTGLPPMFFMDETHFMSVKNTWGEVVGKLSDKGAIIVLLTATAERGDNQRIPGFQWKTEEENDITRRICKPSTDPDKVIVETYKGTEARVILIPDHETTFKDAWEETSGNNVCICKVSRQTFDLVFDEIGLDCESDKKLSDMTETQARRVLGRSLKDPETIKHGVRLFLKDLSSAKLIDGTVQGIVFCGNDEDGEDCSGHARTILSEIRRQCTVNGHDFTSTVLTTVDGTDQERKDASARLTTFREGNGDIAIFKQMAGVGIDMKRVKVVLDMSPVRTLGSCVQRWMRGGTPYGDFTMFSLITPNDIMSDEIYDNWAGGSHGDSKMTMLDLVDITEKDKGDKEPETSYVLKRVQDGTIKDVEGRFGNADDIALSEIFFTMYPSLKATVSKAQAAHCMKESQGREWAGEIKHVEDDVKTIDEIKRSLLDDCMRLHVTLAKKSMGNRSLTEEEKRSFYQNAWKDAKRRSRLEGKPSNMTLEQLQLLKSTMKEMVAR